jgi:hypothetical protein
MPKAETLKKSTIDRIKVAAPLTVGMLIPIVEKIIVDRSIPILSFQWFYNIFFFFILSTFIVSALMYNYKLMEHLCSNCSSRWSAKESDTVTISKKTVKINFIKRYFLFIIEKKFKTYTCEICSSVKNTKSTAITFVGTATEE